MEKLQEKHSAFPKSLPKPDEAVLRWIGEYLKTLRGKKTPNDVAKAAKVPVEQIEKIETGIIHLNFGQFRQIVWLGYGRKFEVILAKCYEVFKDRFNPSGKRRFERD